MSLSVGTKLGPYEILSPVGAGGMGEVYRARDTRLDRTVALKVLPTHVATDPDLRQRFEREARTVAALNHPHICTLHDVGRATPLPQPSPPTGEGARSAGEEAIDFLVMEYLQGETLADRLKKGALPQEQTLRYANQIADALDKVHRQGITHRDLKPGNIMLTKAGAKLLDFGLATLKAPSPANAAALSALPTQQERLTEKGTILGTFQYMAPEQLEAKDADARTDIFAFGTVLYEMATGKRAFEGESQASLTAAILTSHPPPMSSLQPLTPPVLERVVKRCLAKDPEDRWQSARDLSEELKWIAEGSSDAGGAGPLGPRPRYVAWVAAGVIVGAIAAGGAVWSVMRTSSSAPGVLTHTVVSLPSNEQLGAVGASPPMAISPDGTRLVYASQNGGRTQLYLRPLNQFEANVIPGTEGARDPFFSPDGQWVGFFADVTLQKVSVTGGAPQPICDAPDISLGASWGPDDTIVFAAGLSGLVRVPAGGGTPESLTTPDAEKGEVRHSWPQILPGGESVLFTITTEEGPRIGVLSLATGDWRTLPSGGEATQAQYVPTGHLVFAQSGELLGVPFDLARLELDGPPGSVLDGVYASPGLGGLGLAYFAVSRSGSLVYAPGGAAIAENSLVWVDRDGRASPLTGGRGTYRYPRLSPDGRRIAVDFRSQTGDRDIWIYELERGTLSRLTVEGTNRNPVWAREGTQVTFTSNRAGPFDLYWKPADGSGQSEALLTRANSQFPTSWSPDGRQLAFYEVNPTTARDIWVLAQDDDPSPFLRTSFNERSPTFSPDGRWLAYVSNESGRDEIYVLAYPGPGGRSQVSTDGGTEPVWSANGRELFYRNGDQMLTVAVETEPAFDAGDPQLLFEERYGVEADRNPNYDVAPDGQRFVMVKSDQDSAPTQLHVVLDWFEELNARVPRN